MLNLLKFNLNLNVDDIINYEYSLSSNLEKIIIKKDPIIKLVNHQWELNLNLKLDKDFEKAAEISHIYNEAINKVLEMNNEFSIENLSKIYSEKFKSLCLCLEAMERLERMDTSTEFLLKDIKRDEYVVKFYQKEEIKKEKILEILRTSVLEFITENYSSRQEEFKKIKINEIKNECDLLNLIFSLGLFDLVLDQEVIKKNVFDSSISRKLIINFIRIHLTRDPSYEEFLEMKGINNEVQRKLSWEEINNLKIEFKFKMEKKWEYLENFYYQIVETDNIDYITTSIEALLYNNPYMSLPDCLIKVAEERVPEKLMEIYIKFSRFDVKLY